MPNYISVTQRGPDILAPIRSAVGSPIGQEIVQHLQDGKTEEEIKEYILSSYMIDKNTVEKDLYDFLNMLKSYKLTE